MGVVAAAPLLFCFFRCPLSGAASEGGGSMTTSVWFGLRCGLHGRAEGGREGGSMLVWPVALRRGVGDKAGYLG